MAKGDSERGRRSPRLAKSVEVKLAGKSADGALLVEASRTTDISKHGAAVRTEHPYPTGSPIALRRSNGKPMRGRVVSCRSDRDGRYQVGIEFIEDTADWDLEFPAQWHDFYRVMRPEARSEAPRPQAGTETALEAMVQKAETLRAQVDTMLAEVQAQVELARRQSAAAQAEQAGSLRTWKGLMEGEAGAQVQAAQKAIQASTERIQQQFEKSVKEMGGRIEALRSQFDKAIEGSAAAFGQMRASENQKTAGAVAEMSAKLEACRREIGELAQQAAQFREQAAAHLDPLRTEARSVVDGAAREIQAASQAGVKEFRQKMPELGQEMEGFFASFVSEQKTVAARWAEEVLENLRAAMAEMDAKHRAQLEESNRLAAEQYGEGLKGRVDEFRSLGDAVAGPLEARLENARGAVEELAQASERAVAAAQKEISAELERAGTRISEMAGERQTALEAAGSQAAQHLEQTVESMQHTALETSRRMDQSALDLQALSSRLHEQAVKDRKEIENQFGSLMAMYDQRKSALDRLLETLETGRTGLRDEMDLLRVNAVEHRARLQRFSGEQETALRSAAADLDQRLQQTAVNLEAGLEDRVTASVESSHAGLVARLQEAADEATKRFQSALADKLTAASRGTHELATGLERRQKELSQSLIQETMAHTASLAEMRAENTKHATKLKDEIARAAGEHQSVLGQAAAANVASVDDRGALATRLINDMLVGLEQQRLSLTRLHTDTETKIQTWRKAIEDQFASLGTILDERRRKLDQFYTMTDQTRAALVKNMGAVDKRIEDARAAAAATERQMQTALDKHTATLAAQLEANLKAALSAAHTELAAESQAAEEVFQNRIKAFSEERAASAERQIERAGNSAALTLDRTMQKESREYEKKLLELGAQVEDRFREEQQRFQEQARAAVDTLHQQLQSVSQEMFGQVREARENLLRELPGRLAEAETEFRKNLGAIQEQYLANLTRRPDRSLEPAEQE